MSCVFVLGLLCPMDRDHLAAVPPPSLVATDVADWGDEPLENRYWLDELDTTGVVLPYAGTRILTELVERIDVAPEGALDSTVRVSTRRGEDGRRGSAFLYVTPRGAAPEPVGYPRTIDVRSELQHEIVTGAEMGGPLVRGRAWLWMGVAARHAAYDVVRTVRSVTEVLDTRRIAEPESGVQMMARLDVEPTRGQHGKVLLVVAPEHTEGVRARGIVDEQQQEADRTTIDALAQWRAALDPIELVALGGLHRTARRSGSVGGARDGLPLQILYSGDLGAWSGLGGESGAVAAGCRDPGSCPDDGDGYAIGGPGWLTDDVEQRLEARAAATRRTARHQLAVELGVARESYVDRGRLSGDVEYRNYGTFIDQIEQIQPGPFEIIADRADVRVHDVLQLDPSTTVDAGVRLDHLEYTRGTWSPDLRVERTEGRHRLWGRWSRTTEILPLALAQSAFGADRFLYTTFSAIECGPVIDALGGPDPSTCTAQPGVDPIPPFQPADMAFAADLAAQQTDDLALGAEAELAGDLHAGASFQHRALRHVIEDMTIDDALVVANPAGAHRTRDALTLALAYRGVRASYTFSRTAGNYAGLAGSTPHLAPAFDLPELGINSDGPLPDDRRHLFALDAAHTYPVRPGALLLGARLRAASGAPIDALSDHPRYGPGAVHLLPRGAFGRGDALVDLTLRLGWTQTLGGHRLDVFADLLHALDPQGAITVDESYTRDPALPIVDGTRPDLVFAKSADGAPLHRNLAFGSPATRQSPTAIRFGLRVTF